MRINEEDKTGFIPTGVTELSPVEAEVRRRIEKRKQNIIFRKPRRKLWDSRIEFFLAAVGFAVGLGNIWRFPWLLVKNGGGAFLIPYTIMLLVEGIPLLYMELLLGQRFHLGVLPLWGKVSRYAQGLGISQFTTSRVVSCSSVVMAWCIYYFGVSFQSPLPWASCPRVPGRNGSKVEDPLCVKASPTVHYFYNNALQVSNGIDDKDGLTINWKILACFGASNVIICLCLLKGVKSTGKVVYFTVLFPYVALITFLIRGLTLPGMEDGLRFLFSVDFERLRDPYVWLEAATQIFYSLSLSSGGMIAYASYNPANQDALKDTIMISAVNTFTSLMAGLAVFCLLGHRAHYMNAECMVERSNLLHQINNIANRSMYTNCNVHMLVESDRYLLLQNLVANVSTNYNVPNCSVKDILEKSPSGSGLAFMTLSHVITRFPGSTVFSVMFFLMLITMGIDSRFGGEENAVTSIRDLKYFRLCRVEVVIKRDRKRILEKMQEDRRGTGTLMLFSFLIGMAFTTRSGEYYFQVVNKFAIDVPFTFYACVELIAVCYLYGVNRFSDDVYKMTGRKVNLFLKILWTFVSPCILIIVCGAAIYKIIEGKSEYQRWIAEEGTVKNETLPVFGQAAGWFLLTISLMWIPLGALHALWRRWRNRQLASNIAGSMNRTELQALND